MNAETPFHLTGRFTLPAQDRQTWRDKLARYAKTVRAEPGCLSFDLFEAQDRNGDIVTLEVFHGQAGFNAHAEAGHTQQMVADLHDAGVSPLITYLTRIEE